MALPVALSLVLLGPRFSALFESVRPLGRFDDRAIGLTASLGLDASGYAKSYVSLVILLIVALAGLGALAALAGRWLDRRGGRASLVREERWLSRWSEVAAVLALLRLLLRDEGLAPALAVALHILAALVLLVVAKAFWLDRPAASSGTIGRLLDRPELLLAAALAAPPLLLLPSLLVGRAPAFPPLPVTAGFLLGAAVAAGLLALHLAGTRGGEGLAPGRFVAATVPLAAIPLALPLANEIQARFRSLDPSRVALLLAALLLLATLATWLLAGRSGRRLSPSRLLAAGVYPLLLGGAATLRLFAHRRFLTAPDYFHFGEFTLPTQQLFQFGSWPFVDLRPTHGLSDFALQGLYSLLHGYRGLDMLVWEGWLLDALAVVLVYFCLARLVAPGTAALVTALLPVAGIATAYYAPLLLLALVAVRALERPSTLRFALLWGTALALAVWRLDFGIVGTAALLAVLALHLWPGSLGWRRQRHRVGAAARGLGLVAGGTALVLFLLEIASRKQVLAGIAATLHSYTYRLAVRTRPELFESYDLSAALQYVLLPASAAAVVAALALHRLAARRRLPPRAALLLLICLVSLGLSVRSLERHSLVEGFNPYLFLFGLAILPLAWPRPGGRRAGPAPRLWLLSACTASALLALPPVAFWPAPHRLLHLLPTARQVFTPHHWAPGESRTTIDDRRHRALVDFLDRSLAPGETFYDFSNSPLLYVLAERRFPTFVIPNLIQTGEPMQARVVGDLRKLVEDGRLPFVVFAQGDWFWDIHDGVPNAVRSYRIAELIYSRFEPLARFGRYEVWVERGRDREALLAGLDAKVEEEAGKDAAVVPIPPESYRQTFDLRRLPEVWAAHDPFGAWERTAPLRRLLDRPVRLDPEGELAWELGAESAAAGYLALAVAPVWPTGGSGGAEEIRIAAEYGPPEAASGFHFSNPGALAGAEHQALPFAGAAPVLHGMEPAEGMRVYRATGEDPYLHGLFAPGELPPAGADERFYLRLRYRSSLAGTMQLFPSWDGGQFRGDEVVGFELEETGASPEPAERLFLLPVPAAGARLTDLRLDPPDGSIVQIESAELVRSRRATTRHLVRLSSQWPWGREVPRRLTLRASAPVRIEVVELREGD